MKSNLLKKIAGWVIMVFFGMTILTGCDDYNFDIPLTPFLLLDSYNVNFDQNSGERILEVRCNEEWTVELSKELQGWCSVTRNEDDNLIVSVILSEDKYVRRGEFYVKAFSQTDTVRVAQLGYQQAILVSPQNMNIDAAGDKVLVEVTSNVDYIITLPDWIIKETQPDTRAPQETVTKQYLFKIESNKGAKRMGEIVFADSDEMSDLEPTVINVVQKGLDVYEPVAPEEGNDIQLFPNSAEGDGGVPGGNYDATFDNDLTTEWQANWKAPIGLVYPQYIEYTFDEPVDLDYIIYHCTYSANRFKDVKIEVLTDVNKTRSAEYVKVYEGTFDNANSTRADFNASQSNVTKVKFTISTCYNMSNNTAVRNEQIAALKELRANRDEAAVQKALADITECVKTKKGNLLELAVKAAGLRASLGEISDACEVVVGRYKAIIRTISGVYSSETKKDADFQKACELCEQFAKKEGRQPRIMIAKMGQDGHDRGAKVVATGYADCGFDVDMGPLFQTPAEAAREAVENDVHVVGVSSLAAGHKTLVPQIIEELKKLGREDIVVIAGGVIPAQDYDFLYKAGVAAIFGPGTPVAKAACQILEILMDEE